MSEVLCSGMTSEGNTYSRPAVGVIRNNNNTINSEAFKIINTVLNDSTSVLIGVPTSFRISERCDLYTSGRFASKSSKHPTRWSTTLSLKVNLNHAIDIRTV